MNKYGFIIQENVQAAVGAVEHDNSGNQENKTDDDSGDKQVANDSFQL